MTREISTRPKKTPISTATITILAPDVVTGRMSSYPTVAIVIVLKWSAPVALGRCRHDAPVRQGRRRSRGSDGGLTGHGCARSAEIVGRIVFRGHPLPCRNACVTY
jgi:hypothetical protein